MVWAKNAALSSVLGPRVTDLVKGNRKRPLYLCLGHVTRDVDGTGWSFGGPAYFASRTAAALGCTVTVVTRLSAGDLTLLGETAPNIDWLSRPAVTSTMFENTYGSGGRTQRVYDRAPRLTIRDVGVIPLDVRILHIAPVLREIGPTFLGEVVTNRFVALTAQGLLRNVNADGFVSAVVPRSARFAFESADVSVVSVEDFDGDVAKACELLGRSKVGVLTDGHRPIHAHESGRWFEFPVLPRPTRKPTGTGDVFAAALFVRYEATGNLEGSLRFAATAAADWVSARDPEVLVMSASSLA